MSEQLGPQESQLNTAALMQQFAEWLLLPPAERKKAGLPARQKGMAELLGRSEATLSMWKKNEKFQRMMNRHVRANFGADRLGRVIDSLYDVATGVDAPTAAAQVSAAKTLLNWYETGAEATVEAGDLEQMSTEELRVLAQRVLSSTEDV